MNNEPLTVKVTRQRMRRYASHGWKWYYEVRDTPDGKRFTNDSIVTLRQVLKRHYGPKVRIIEQWQIKLPSWVE